jgi:hypothetical protein
VCQYTSVIYCFSNYHRPQMASVLKIQPQINRTASTSHYNFTQNSLHSYQRQ